MLYFVHFMMFSMFYAPCIGYNNEPQHTNSFDSVQPMMTAPDYETISDKLGELQV